MKEYRIDDLAREARVSVRNVRVYQDRGLLPPPRKQGRTGWYNEAHLARLHLIGRMLDRGYTFATISELLSAAHYGLQVKDVLETDDPGSRWRNRRRAARVSLSELRRMFGAQTTAANIARGTDLGVLAPTGDDYSVDNPHLVEAARVLVEAGVPLDDVLEQTEAVHRGLTDVAARFVGVVAERYLAAEGETLDLDESTVTEIAKLVDRMRPLAHDVVETMFEAAMEEQISKALSAAARQLGEKTAAERSGDTNRAS
ncbi:MAG: MerR family transcriptional regulator [Rhodococcus sp. (in: high G+C Gram-positive bacteria)]|uniref:MerR family transcriptional regulator n=1 Tax=Rhodococcus sp. TaxID=1831 RepID=UPI003BB12D6B